MAETPAPTPVAAPETKPVPAKRTLKFYWVPRLEPHYRELMAFDFCKPDQQAIIFSRANETLEEGLWRRFPDGRVPVDSFLFVFIVMMMRRWKTADSVRLVIGPQFDYFNLHNIAGNPDEPAAAPAIDRACNNVDLLVAPLRMDRVLQDGVWARAFTFFMIRSWTNRPEIDDDPEEQRFMAITTAGVAFGPRRILCIEAQIMLMAAYDAGAFDAKYLQLPVPVPRKRAAHVKEFLKRWASPARLSHPLSPWRLLLLLLRRCRKRESRVSQ